MASDSQPGPARPALPPPGPPLLDLLLLLGFFCGVAALCVVWVSLDRTPLRGDHAEHIRGALKSLKALREGDLYQWLVPFGSNYPPLTYGATSLLLAVTGPSLTAVRLSPLLFTGPLMLLTYLLGRDLYGRRAGLLAAFFVVTCPLAFFFSFHLFLDLPAATLVALSLYLLGRSDGFRAPVPTLLLGAALALGMLTKWSFVFFVAGALLHVALAGLARRRSRLALLAAATGAGVLLYQGMDPLRRASAPYYQGMSLEDSSRLLLPWGAMLVLMVPALWWLWRRRRSVAPRALHLLGAGALFLVLCLPYYLVNLNSVLAHGTYSTIRREGWRPLVPQSWAQFVESVDYFGRFIVFELLSPGYLALLALGAAALALDLLRRRAARGGATLLCTLLTALAILYVIPDQKGRYFLPALAPMAVLATGWIAGPGRRWLPRLLGPAVLALGLFQVTGWLLLGDPPRAHGWDRIRNPYHIAPAPQQSPCAPRDLTSLAAAESGRGRVHLVFFLHHHRIEDYISGYELLFELSGRPWQLINTQVRPTGLGDQGSTPGSAETLEVYRNTREAPRSGEVAYLFRLSERPLDPRPDPRELGRLGRDGFPAGLTLLKSCQMLDDGTWHAIYKIGPFGPGRGAP